MIKEVTCEYIASARPIDKAIVAEILTRSLHKITRCDKCEKFHVWVQVSMSEWAGPNSVNKEARTSNYVQVGPNAYLHWGYKNNNKKKGKEVKVASDEE